MQELLNKLVLGTAQLGLEYGINNKSGKPSREEALKILEFAYKNGIKIFDTASAYGSAEEILGGFCKRCNLADKIKVITKIKRDIKAELNESLARLKMNYVDGCLLHEPKDIRNEKMIELLREAKNLGLAKNIGVSVYEPKDAVYAAELSELDYIQVSYNVFDQRLDKTNFFELAKKNSKKIFARSPFLQGLLIIPEEEIPAHLKGAKPYLAKLNRIIAKHGFLRKQAALRFALENENIDYVVFGADNKNQLKEIINISNQKIDFNQCRKELKNEFKEVSKYIISPNLWE